MKKFDVLIIGTGSAGQTAAYPLKSAGKSVAIVDNRPYGGTCANRGCDPKKVLVAAAEAIDWFERIGSKKALKGRVIIDWDKLMTFKKSFVEDVPKQAERGLKEAGITTFFGTASFIGPKTVSIGEETVEAESTVIATGANPVSLKITGEELVTISDDFLDLRSLPKRIIFIGGGFISFEFAHVACRAGSEVTILHRSEQVLRGFDPDLVEGLVKASTDLGINVYTNTPVVSVAKGPNGLIVRTKLKSGVPKSFEADLVVHGGGRVPNIEKLELEKGNIEVGEKGVKVNEFLQSISNPHIYAAGDVCDYGLPLTPVAGKEGAIVAENIIKGNKRQVHFSEMPSVVFTLPPLASVGLREDQAKDKGFDIQVKFEKTSDWYSSKRIGEKYSAYKTIVDKKTGLLLGAHLLGHDSENIINIFAFAIAQKIKTQFLKELIYAYPTRSSDIEYMV